MSDVDAGPFWGDPVAADPPDVIEEGPARRRRRRRWRRRRIRYRVGFLHRTASLLELVILWAILAAVVSGLFAGIVAGLSLALHRLGG